MFLGVGVVDQAREQGFLRSCQGAADRLDGAVETAAGMGPSVQGEADRHVVDLDDVGGRAGTALGEGTLPEELHLERLHRRVTGLGRSERYSRQQLVFGIVDMLAQEERLVWRAGAPAQVRRPVGAAECGPELCRQIVGGGDSDDEDGVAQLLAACDDGGVLVAAAAGGGSAFLGEAAADGVVVLQQRARPVDSNR